MTRFAARFARQTCALRLDKPRNRKPRLTVQSLEGRTVPAQFLVLTTAGDNSAGSLGDMISQADALPGDDEIKFDTGGAFSGPSTTITLTSPLPQITDNLTITGYGTTNLAVDGAGSFQVFNSVATQFTLTNFTVKGGMANEAAGGGIFAAGSVSLDHMNFTGNTATHAGSWSFDIGVGGAIAIDRNGPFFLTVKNSTLSGNSASVNGGAISIAYGASSMLIENSTISGNSTSYSGGLASYFGGGGIFVTGAPSTSPPPGYVSGAMVIRNSTIANNNTPGSGGGVWAWLNGTLEVQNSTISGNTAISGANNGNYSTGGGGIGNYRYVMTLNLENSIVSGNFDPNNAPDINVPTTTNAKFSAIGDSTGALTPNFDAVTTSLIGQALNLGPLGPNGGPTDTMVPGGGSPLIDAGSLALLPSGMNRDQRNLTRLSGTSVDIGSVETQPPGVPLADAIASDVLTPGGTSYVFQVVFSDTNGGANPGIKVSTINGANANSVIRVTGPNGFNVPATFISVVPGADGTPLTATYSITPPNTAWAGPDSGLYSINVQANQVFDLDGNPVSALPAGTFLVSINQTFVVTNADPGGAGSLADAVAKANAAFTDDTITFDPNFFSTPRSISLAATLAFSGPGGSLTINGPGVNNLKVDAGGNFRALDSDAPTLTLSGFTVTGGLADNSAGLGNGEFGGGLRAGGFVTLDHMVFTGNQAIGPNNYYYDVGAGGGIGMKAGGFLLVRNSTIANNMAEQKGAGIFFRSGGGLEVENSTISGNTITPEATGTFFEGWGGGAIFFRGSPGNGVPAGFTPGAVVIQNSTVSGNTSPGSGGGFEGFSMYGSLLLQDSTVTGNTASTTSNYYGGGGLAARYSGFAITLQNSIVSGNTNTAAPDIMTYGAVYGYYSAIGSLTGAGYQVLDAVSTNLVGRPLLLSALGDFGGPTQSITPLVNSPLIDAGSDGLIPGTVTNDQRGLDRIFGTAVDIGSYEVQPPKVTVEQAATQADPTNQPTINFDVTFTVPVTGFDETDLDFSASTAGGLLAGVVTQTGPTTYTVAVTGMTSDGDVTMSVVAGAGQDPAGLGSLASTSIDNTVTYDTTAPTVTINEDGGQADPTNVGPIDFMVHFSEAIVGFGIGSIDLTGSTGVGAPTVGSITPVGPDDYLVHVVGMNGTGNVVAKINAGAVTDAAGNTSAASTSTDNSVAFDNVAPGVTINKGATQLDPTSQLPITFDVVFSEPVVDGTFDQADVDLSASTAGVGAAIITVTKVTSTNYTVKVDGVTSRGDVVAKVVAGGVKDLAGNLNTASTSTDNTVAFLHAGVINLSTSTVTTAEGATITITAKRTGGSEGIVSVDYTTLTGTAHASDFTAAPGFTLAGTLSWGEGDSADKTFDIKIVDDANNEGKENFTVGLSNAVGGVLIGATSTETISIAPSDGQVINGAAVKPAKPQFIFTDGDGDLVTVKLGGKLGTATVFITDPDGDGKGPLELIQLAGTDAAKSTLTITAKKAKGGIGNGRAGLAELTGADLKSLTATTTDMVGPGITMSGFLNTVSIGSIGGGADITVNGIAPAGAKGAKTGLSLTSAQTIGDGTDITLAQIPLLKLKTYSVGTGGTISAPYAGTIQTTGNKKAGNAGDFGSNITLSGVGVPAKTPALKSLNIKGAANGILIKVASGTGTVGDVGSVSVGSFINSRLFAGYSGPDNGSGAFNLAATIGKFTATNPTTSFAHSFVIGTNFKSASKLTSVDTANGGTKFGFVFHGTYGGLNLPSLKLHYNTKTQGTQTFGGDLEVLKV